MQLLARFAGPNGEIAVIEDRSTGARHYREGGVSQSCVLPGGEAGVAYVRLMAALLAGSDSVLLLGCGGGSLASMLHRGGSSVTILDVNPVSFELARTFFWMPSGVECIVGDMRAFMRKQTRRFDAIGIDVGGPDFSYDEVLDHETIPRIRRALREDGRITVNISCEAPDDPIPGRIAARFKSAGLDVWVFMESAAASGEINAVILASARRETPAALAALMPESWSIAQLTN